MKQITFYNVNIHKILTKFVHSSLYDNSGVTLLFEHLPNQARETEHFEIFSCLQENQLAQ